jgi:hypothetical protein
VGGDDLGDGIRALARRAPTPHHRSRHPLAEALTEGVPLGAWGRPSTKRRARARRRHGGNGPTFHVVQSIDTSAAAGDVASRCYLAARGSGGGQGAESSRYPAQAEAVAPSRLPACSTEDRQRGVNGEHRPQIPSTAAYVQRCLPSGSRSRSTPGCERDHVTPHLRPPRGSSGRHKDGGAAPSVVSTPGWRPRRWVSTRKPPWARCGATGGRATVDALQRKRNSPCHRAF